MSTEDTAQDDREIDPKENFVQHHAESGTFTESAAPAEEEGGSMTSLSIAFTDVAGIPPKPCVTCRAGSDPCCCIL